MRLKRKATFLKTFFDDKDDNKFNIQITVGNINVAPKLEIYTSGIPEDREVPKCQ